MKTNIGDTSSFFLDNGLGVFVCRNPKAPIATFQIWIQTGSVNEGKYAGSGISHFLEHMSFKGSKNYDKNQIISIIDKLGARINASTSYSKTIYYVNCRSAKIAKAADVIMDIVRNPLFPEDEFEKERDVIARERAMYSDSPDSFLFEKMMQTMYLKSPMRHPIIGYMDMIMKVKCSDLFDYHKSKYRPERTFIVACGDIEPEDVFAIVKSKLDDWENNSYNDELVYKEDMQSSSRERSFFFKDPLARIAISFHSSPASDPMAPSFDVLSYILAGSESSRLLKKIEREKKLSTSINSFNYSFLHGGIFAVTAACEKSRIEELKKNLFDEIYAISRGNPPSETELKRAFTGISFSFLKSLKSINTVASLIGNSLLYYGDYKYVLRYLDIIKSLDTEKIIYAAENCLKEENSNIVTVLPEEKKEKKKLNSCNTLKKPREKIQIIKNTNIPDILFLPDNDLPIFDFCFLSKANHFFETIENAGISSLFASTITGGCKSLDEEKIMSLIDDNAIDLSFSESKHTILSLLSAPLESFDLSMDLLLKIFSEATFPEYVIEREKNIELNSLQSEILSPINTLIDELNRIFYEGHHYSIGSNEKLKVIPLLTREILLNFYKEYFITAKSGVIGISGKISDAELDKLISTLKNIPWKTDSIKEPFPPSPLRSSIKKTIPLPRSQTIVSLSFPAFSIHAQERYLLNLAIPVLNGMNSSLFKKVREENGMAYFTGFSYEYNIYTGKITLYAGISEKDIPKTLQIFYSEVERMKTKGALSETEFSNAKEKILFNITENRADPANWLVNGVTEYLLKGQLDIFENSEDFYQQLNLDDVNAAISKSLSSEHFVELIILPEHKDEKHN